MGVPSVVLGLLVPVAVQWLLVTAGPTGTPSTTPMGLAGDASSKAPGRAAFIPVADSANSRVHSEEEDTVPTDTPATSGKVQDAAGENPATVATDQHGSTAGPAATTPQDSLAAGAGGVVGSTQLSALVTSPSSSTAAPVTVPASTTTKAPTCPPGCKCEHLEVHCSRAGLSAFPEGLDPKTTYLDVGHNRLTAIADDELANLGLTKLTSLICDDNLIETVGEYAFRGLRDLALLQLSGNRIRRMSQFVFVGNDDLRHIDLTGNPLDFPRGPLFSVQQVEYFDLDNCNLTRLPIDSFRDMRGLRYLNLSGNRITYLMHEHFHGLNYLRYVKLAGNPLVCNCEMKPIWRRFRDQAVNVEAKCISPINGSSQSWDYLELMECSGRRN